MSKDKQTEFTGKQNDAGKRLEQALMLSSIVTAVAVVLLFLNVIFSLTLMQLSSKVNVLPYLVFNKPRVSDDIVGHEIFDPQMVSVKDICEIYVRRYLELKYGYYKDEEYMKYLWEKRVPGYGVGVFRKIASPKAYNKFYQSEDKLSSKISGLPFSSQRVIFDNVSYKQNGKNIVWDVAFSFAYKKTSYMSEEPVIEKGRKIALGISFVRSYKRFSRRGGLNPLGIAVSEGEGF